MSIPISEKITVDGDSDTSVQLYQPPSSKRHSRSVIFVHGSPGKAQHWSRYLADPDLKRSFNLIAYDRPGYARSSTQFADLDKQIEVLGGLLGKQTEPAILVGHSLGGAIVLGAAALYPVKVSRVIALAPSADPAPIFVFRLNRFLRFTHLGKLLPGSLYTSHLEMRDLSIALEKQKALLARITAPVTIVQGQRDRLVPPSSIPFLITHLTETQPKIILLEKEGHFLPWKRYQLVKDLLLEEGR